MAAILSPYLSAYLLILKRLKRVAIEKDLSQDLLQLLQVIVLKMKYDPDEPFRMGAEAGEEEALFLELRKSLKVHMESIAVIDTDLFSNCIHGLVCSAFEGVLAQQRGGKAVLWVDAELPLYLLYIYTEATTCVSQSNATKVLVRGSSMYHLNDGTLTPLGLMLSKMMESGVSGYPHESIPLIFFEVVIRYAQFFEHHSQYIPEALQAFLDARGLHHNVPSIRIRINYLFLRFVKMQRSILYTFAENILSAIHDLIVIQPRKINAKTNEVESFSSAFDSQVYLFEAIGYLISLDMIPVEKQVDLLNVILINLVCSNTLASTDRGHHYFF